MAEEIDFKEPVITTSDGQDKITIIHDSPEHDAVTFCLNHEDHTLGNALRWMIMKDPDVEFCGYSAPHPSEPKIHLRIQMYDGKSAVECLMTGLANLKDLFKSVKRTYDSDIEHGNYTRTSDPDIRAEVDQIVAETLERRKREAAEAEAGAAGAGGDVEMA